MIAEMEIEEKLKAQFGAALASTATLPSLRTVGVWDVMNDGEVKSCGGNEAATIAVAVGIRNYDTFQTPTANFACSLALAVRRDACPTGAAIADLIEPLLAKIHGWNADEDSVYDDLTTEHFFPAGFQLVGGPGPVYENASGCWTISIDFNIKGRIG